MKRCVNLTRKEVDKHFLSWIFRKRSKFDEKESARNFFSNFANNYRYRRFVTATDITSYRERWKEYLFSVGKKKIIQFLCVTAFVAL